MRVFFSNPLSIIFAHASLCVDCVRTGASHEVSEEFATDEEQIDERMTSLNSRRRRPALVTAVSDLTTERTGRTSNAQRRVNVSHSGVNKSPPVTVQHCIILTVTCVFVGMLNR